KPVVARRLREFLQLSADVDFDARLKTQDGRSVFENPAYQAKSSQWKMCFRAGREATAAARAAVQAWLTELGGEATEEGHGLRGLQGNIWPRITRITRITGEASGRGLRGLHGLQGKHLAADYTDYADKAEQGRHR